MGESKEKKQEFINHVETLFEVPYQNILAYDIEVFEHQSSIVFTNLDKEVVRIYTDNLNGLGEYLDKGWIIQKGYDGMGEWLKDKVLLGYNNYWYDDYILYAMTMPLYSKEKEDPHFRRKLIKMWNDSIIQNSTKVNMKKFEGCRTYDVMQQIDVSKPGLKKIEGNLGHNIMESSVDFDIDRELTSKENREVVDYNINDVKETVHIFKMRIEYFESKKSIVNMLPEELRNKAYRWNTTSIVGQLLRPNRPVRGGRLVSDDLLSLVPLDVQNMWKELDTTSDYKFKQKKVIVEQHGVVYEFGWGGLHAVPKGVIKRSGVKLWDGESLYPTILILLNGLGDKTEEYDRIRKHRFKLKHEGKKKEQAPYKLILNTMGLSIKNSLNTTSGVSIYAC